MFRVCFDKKLVKNIFRTTSGERMEFCSKEIFLRTHFPMKFEVKEPAIEAIEYDEEDLIRKILAPHSGNKIYLLIGDTGSGKSEFCMYLKCKTEENKKLGVIPIHIHKYKLTLEKVVKTLIEHLSEVDGKKYQENFRVIQLNADQASYIANIIVNQVLLERVLGLTDDFKNKIIHYLSNKVAKRIKRYLQFPPEGTEREPEAFTMLEKSEFKEVLSQSGIELRDFELPYKYLRQKLAKKFRDFMKLPDISYLLEKISKDFEKKKQRPLLLVDDIVTLGPMVYDFIDFLSTLEVGNWDAVIGVTPGKMEMLERPREMYEDLKGMETLRERSTEIFLTRGRESTFLNEDNCIKFIQPYLELIKDCKNCPCQSLCATLFKKELCPFNQVFILRTFHQLSNQTPREFVQKIKELLLRIDQGNPPYQVARLLDLKVPITVTTAIFERNKKLANCVSWYGELDSKKKFLVVRKSLLDFFSITQIPTEIAFIKDEKVYVPIIPVPERIVKELTIRKPVEIISPEISKENEVIALSVQNWLQGGVDFPENGSLRRGVYEVIKRIQPFEKITGPSMSRGIESIDWDKQHQGLPLPIVIEDVDDIPSYPHMLVKRDMLKDNAYRLTFLGHLCLKESPEAEEVLNDVIFKLNVNLLNKLGSQFQESLKTDLEKRLQLPKKGTIEDWVLHSFALLYAVFSGDGAPGVQDLKNGLSVKFDEPKSWLNAVSDKLPKTTELLRVSAVIQELFRSFFSFRKSTIDFSKVAKKLSTTDVRELEWNIIGYLKEIKGENVPEYYELHDKPFKDAVRLVSDSAEELFDYDYSEEYQKTNDDLTKIYGYVKDISSSYLEEITKEIKNLNKYSPVWLRTHGKKLIEYIRDNKSNLVDPAFGDHIRKTKEMPICGPLSFLSYLKSCYALQRHKIIEFVNQIDRILKESEEIKPVTVNVQEALKEIVQEISVLHKEIRKIEK